MQFVKSHGAGNDFVLIEDLEDRLGILPPSLVAAICDRHKGVGGDGLIRITRAPGSDFFMDYYNADGEVAEMCGNGIRCLGKYVADRGITTADSLRVDTRAGVKRLELYRDDDGLVDRVRVDMGAPILAAADIPVDAPGDPLHVAVTADGVGYEAACVSMGNPHAVVFVAVARHDPGGAPRPGDRDLEAVPRQDQRRVHRGDLARRGARARVGTRRRGDAGVRHRRVCRRRRGEPPRADRQARDRADAGRARSRSNGPKRPCS